MKGISNQPEEHEGTSRRARAPFPSDDVISLREWCGERRYPLSPDDAATSHGGGAITLTLEHRQWHIRADGPEADLLVDGVPCRSAKLRTGSLVSVRGLKLIVESARTIALTSYLSRLLGWSPPGRVAVDEALQMMRIAHAEGAPLLVKAEGSVTDLVRGLHDRTVGPGAPFVECRRTGYHKKTRYGVSGVLVQPAGLKAYQEAQQGTLFVSETDLPDDFGNVLEAARSRPGHVQVILGAPHRRPSELLPATLAVPPISERKAERDLIIIEYLEEAADELGLKTAGWRLGDLDWIEKFSAATHADIHEGARYVLAIVTSASLEEASRRLATDVVSLDRWLDQRMASNPIAERQRLRLACRGR